MPRLADALRATLVASRLAAVLFLANGCTADVPPARGTKLHRAELRSSFATSGAPKPSPGPLDPRKMAELSGTQLRESDKPGHERTAAPAR